MSLVSFFFFFFKQKTAYEMELWLEFRRVLFRSMVLSTPIPVSTVFCFSGRYSPSAVLLYCMNTSLHTSKYLPQVHPGLHPLPHFSFPVSINISVSGPQGPVTPAGPHQLSFFGRKNILSFGIPSPSQIFSDSSSFGASLSPANTVTERLSLSNPSHFSDVRNSRLQLMASFFQ